MTELNDLLQRLAERGDHRPVDDVLAALRTQLSNDTTTESHEEFVMLETAHSLPSTSRRPGLGRFAYAAVAVVFVGLVGAAIYGAARSGSDATRPTAGGGDTAVQPALTLPPIDNPGAPVTAFSSEPDYSYRLTPDVEIGWSGLDEGETLFCWRTPVIEDCGSEPAPGTAPITVAVAPNQTVAIVAVGGVDDGYSMAGSVELTLDDGSTVTAAIEWRDSPITIGSARFDIAAGRIVSTTTVE